MAVLPSAIAFVDDRQGLVALMDDVPHIALPIRVKATEFATVQQDTGDELACTVNAIAAFPLGFRVEAPEFGVEPLEFGPQPLDLSDLEQACELYEPRARLALTEAPYDPADPTAARVTIAVSMHSVEDL